MYFKEIALNGGIAIQDRMAFQGEYFVNLYGKEAAKRTPPIYRMLDLGIPVGAGSDATRVSSYNPWVALYWMVAGKTIGGLSIYDEKNKLDRKVALELYSKGSAWFSGDEGKKGTLAVGQFADIAVLSADYFTVPEEEIKNLESLLTIMGGQVVYGNDEFKNLSPELPPASPDWSPTGVYGYGGANLANTILSHDSHDNKLHSCSNPLHQHTHTVIGKDGTTWGIGCTCFAF